MTAQQPTAPEDAVAELRALADALLERVEPWLRSGAQPTAGTAGVPDCGWCPLCAIAAALRGDRPDLARRLAEQGVGWLSALRSLLEVHDQSCAATTRTPEEPAGSRIQRITVRDTGNHG